MFVLSIPNAFISWCVMAAFPVCSACSIFPWLVRSSFKLRPSTRSLGASCAVSQLLQVLHSSGQRSWTLLVGSVGAILSGCSLWCFSGSFFPLLLSLGTYTSITTDFFSLSTTAVSVWFSTRAYQSVCGSPPGWFPTTFEGVSHSFHSKLGPDVPVHCNSYLFLMFRRCKIDISKGS